MSTISIILIALIVALLVSFPTWPYSRSFGWTPATVIGAIIAAVLLLLVLDKI